MPRTSFRPARDGFKASTDPTLDPETARTVRSAFADARHEVIGLLERTYGRSVLEAYGVTQKLSEWIDREDPGEFGDRRGAVHAAADYFHARRLRLPKRGDRAFERYVVARGTAALRASAVRSLSGMAVLNLIPRRWLPRAWLAEPTRRTLNAIGLTGTPTIDLDLRPPQPGGEDWIRKTTEAELEELERHLRRDAPWPIGLYQRRASPYGVRYVLAVGCDSREGRTTVSFYDPTRPAGAGRIELGSTGEDDGQGREVDRVYGFFCESYRVEEPPSSALTRILSTTGARTVLWHLLRLLRLR